MNKAKEKTKNKNTKDKNLLDLDNEIIIGIKNTPAPNTKKKNSAKKQTQKRKSSNSSKQKKVNKKTTNKNKSKINNDEIELRLGIEDESIKRKQRKPVKRKPKLTQEEQEKAQKKRKHIFRIVKWTSLVVLILGGTIYFLLSPFFNIKDITTSGNEKITSEELISLSGIQIDENTFKVSSSKVTQAIKTNAYIEGVTLKRSLPSGIKIIVKERKPAYMITLGNAYVYVNTQGYLLEISKEALELPIITGYLTPEDQIQAGNRLCTEDLERLNSVIQIIDSANSNEIGKYITKINITDKQNYIIEMKSKKKTIHLGDISNLSTKMLYIKEIIEKEKKEGEIFVNTDLNTKGAIFREKV